MSDSADKTSKWLREQVRKGSPRAGYFVEEVMRQQEKEKDKKSSQEKARREDGEIRKEIQLFIKSKVEQGYPPDQLLKRLNFVYGSPKYQSYKKYYKTWIMSAIELQAKKNKKEDLESDKEERE